MLLRSATHTYERFAKPIDTLLALIILVALSMPELDALTSLGWDTAVFVHVKLKNVVFLGLFVAFWPPLLRACGMYNFSLDRSIVRTLEQATLGCGIGTVMIALFAELTGSQVQPFSVMVGFWLAASVATASVHWFMQGGARVARQVSGNPPQRQVLVVGTSPRAVFHSRVVEKEPGCTVIGFVDDIWPGADPTVSERRIGGLDELELILMRTVVDEVIVALPVKSCYGQIERAIRSCERLGVESKCIIDYFRPMVGHPRMARSGDVPAVSMLMVPDDARRWIKRLFDILVASLALLILLPVFLLIAIAVKMTSPGPAFFAQERFGYKKRRFQMYKFRSMIADAERVLAEIEHLNEAQGPVFKIRNDPRITPIGQFLRQTSLDELPQLFNVVKGEMSLVGPRPLSSRDVALFDEPWLMRRFSVQPGLTCIWQVSGRSALSFDEWMALDLQYIDHWTLRLDFEILARTFPAVLRGRGAM